MKGAHLRDVLAIKIPRAELKQKLAEFYTSHRFQELRFEDLKKELERMSGMDLTGFMEEWYTQRGVPEFLVNGIQVKKAETGEDGEEKYIVSFNVWNKSRVDGLISSSVEGRRQDRLTELPPVHYLIRSGECRTIRLSYPAAPRVVQVGTNISGNMPLDFAAMIRGDIGVARDTVCGIFDADTKIFAPEPFEIITDNEDENFHLPWFE